MKRLRQVAITALLLVFGFGAEGGGSPGPLAQAGCIPLTCSSALAACGMTSDGCGGTLKCGGCPSGQVCTNNNCYAANCTPMTCQQVGSNCGCSGDGCGNVICCGTCPVGAYCNDIVCVTLCTPPNCPTPTIRTTEFQPCSGGVCAMGDGNVGVGFALTVVALGGSVSQSQRPYRWSVVGGSLPPGLTLDPSLGTTDTLLHGTPTTAGISTFTLQVEDDAQMTAQQSFSITIGTGNLDSLAITGASFNTRRSQLFVAAVDPNIDAVLTVFLTATGRQIGTLHTAGTGTYNGTFTVSPTLNPRNITVTSSRGASTSSAVTFFSRY